MVTDTDEAAQLVRLTATRRLAASERVRLAVEMSEAARRIAIDGERRRHPERSSHETLTACAFVSECHP